MDRIWGIWGSDYNTPKAIFYLIKGDCRYQVDTFIKKAAKFL